MEIISLAGETFNKTLYICITFSAIIIPGTCWKIMILRHPQRKSVVERQMEILLIQKKWEIKGY